MTKKIKITFNSTEANASGFKVYKNNQPIIEIYSGESSWEAKETSEGSAPDLYLNIPAENNFELLYAEDSFGLFNFSVTALNGTQESEAGDSASAVAILSGIDSDLDGIDDSIDTSFSADFGKAIYITPDDKYIAIGVQGETQGATEVYELNSNGSVKRMLGDRIVPDNPFYEEDLDSQVAEMDVKLSNDGQRLLIAAANDGAVYIYDLTDQGWQLNFTKYWNLGPETNNGFLRADLSFDGKYFAVSNTSHDGGAFEGPKVSGGGNYGMVLIYKETEEGWSPEEIPSLTGHEFELLGSKLKFASYSNKLFIVSHKYGSAYEGTYLLGGYGKLALYDILPNSRDIIFEKIGESKHEIGIIADMIELSDGSINVFAAGGSMSNGDTSEYPRLTDTILIGQNQSSQELTLESVPYYTINELETSCINAALTQNKLFGIMKTMDGTKIHLVSWNLNDSNQVATLELDLSYEGSSSFTQVDWSLANCEYKICATEHRLYLSLKSEATGEKFWIIDSKVDVDGDGILDKEDLDLTDGPLADADGDGILNKDDEVYSYTVSINTQNGQGIGAGKYNPGDDVAIVYIPDAGYKFESMSSSDVELSGNSFVMPQKNVVIDLVFSEKDETKFGQAIYVTPDEKYMALTIEGEDQGVVEVYELNTDSSINRMIGSRIIPNNPNYTETLSTKVGAVDIKLSNDGRRLLVAAWHYAIIYIYDLKDGEWTLNYTNLWPTSVSNTSGSAVMRADLSHDGKFFAIGFPSYDRENGSNSGAVLIYKETDTGWHYGSDFIPLINGSEGDVLGANVKFATYSNKLLVSRHHWGTAYNNAWGKLYLYDISTEGKTILLDQNGAVSNSAFGILANIKEFSNGEIKIFGAETESTGLSVAEDAKSTKSLLIGTYINQDTAVSFEKIPYYSIDDLTTSCISSAFTDNKFFAVMKTSDGSKTHLVSWLLNDLQAQPVFEKDLTNENSAAFTKVNWDGITDYPVCAATNKLFISFINKTKGENYSSL